MELKVGLRYRTRDGQVTSPLEFDDHTDLTYPFSGYVGESGQTWNRDGLFYADAEDSLDLVSVSEDKDDSLGEPTSEDSDYYMGFTDGDAALESRVVTWAQTMLDLSAPDEDEYARGYQDAIMALLHTVLGLEVHRKVSFEILPSPALED